MEQVEDADGAEWVDQAQKGGRLVASPYAVSCPPSQVDPLIQFNLDIPQQCCWDRSTSTHCSCLGFPRAKRTVPRRPQAPYLKEAASN